MDLCNIYFQQEKSCKGCKTIILETAINMCSMLMYFFLLNLRQKIKENVHEFSFSPLKHCVFYFNTYIYVHTCRTFIETICLVMTFHFGARPNRLLCFEWDK